MLQDWRIAYYLSTCEDSNNRSMVQPPARTESGLQHMQLSAL